MSRSLGADGRSWHLAFPNVLTPSPSAPFHGSGEPRKEPGDRESCGDSAGAGGSWIGSTPSGLRPVLFPALQGKKRSATTRLEERTDRKKPLPA